MKIKMYNVKETSEYLQVTEAQVRKLLNKGALKGYNVSRKWLIREDSIFDYLEKNSNKDLVEKYEKEIKEMKEMKRISDIESAKNEDLMIKKNVKE